VKNQRGFALVITLLVTALLVAIVVEFITEVYVDTSSRQGFVDSQKAGLLAESGIEGGIKLLQFALNIQRDYTSLKDSWAKPLNIPEEQGSLRVTIEEENGKLNLNYISGPSGEFNPNYWEPAVRLLKKLGLPAADLCDSLADWIDTNDTPKPGGAENSWYMSRKPPYNARNDQLRTVEELRLVKGFDGNLLERIRPFITIYADYGEGAYININTAPREVLLALDDQMTDSLVDRILEYRKETPFKSRGELSRVAGMENIVARIKTPLRTRGSIYLLKAEGAVNGTRRVIETVVTISGSIIKTLYWREY
jgi:general secretion pathway protein K